ncbi:hypothetical protein DAEQUDRAFT_721589 [Daedalea quercina L-15889]|uniref:DUF4139 domain-containing protein n=1 Tax=Daedalea quercina L-15889 TaxID=1314783 RepID=A0A165TJE5_9APHY|nr:hypothetical protein DAEQUDRAFT_721589 [Daedalea quercina L-15889]
MAGRRSTVATIRKLDDEIAEIDRALSGPAKDPKIKGETTGRVSFVIVASEPCSVELEIAYNVCNASWKAYYDLYATTADGQPVPAIALHYNARVTHTSGEDWTDAKFTFVPVDVPRRERDAEIPLLVPRKLYRIPTGFGSIGFPRTSLVGSPPSGPMPSKGVSLFGQPASTGESTTPSFGRSNGPSHKTTNNPPSQQAGGLFGSLQNTATPHPTQSLFGSLASSADSQYVNGRLPSSAGQTAFGSGGLFGSVAPSSSQSPAYGAAAGLFVSEGASSPFKPTDTPGVFKPDARPEPNAADKAPPAVGSFFSKSQPVTKPQIDNGTDDGSAGNSGVPDMRITALGEKITIRESALADHERFSARETASIPSDGEGHTVPIATHVFDAAFTWVCVPRSRAAVFVECRSKNASAHTLVAGSLTVYIDGNEVTKTKLKDTKPQDTFVAPFGVDDAVRVLHRRTARTEEVPERPFTERLWTTSCTARYAVTNGHTFMLPKLLLRDALPVSVNAQVAVVIKVICERDPQAGGVDSQSEPGAAHGSAVLGENVREPDGKKGDGIFEWVRGVDAGQTAVLQAEWEVHTSANVSWDEVPVPQLADYWVQ